MKHNLFDSLQQFRTSSGLTGQYYSLPALERAGLGKISRLPLSIRIVLESILRNCDGKKVTEEHIRELSQWKPGVARTDEIPFVVARVVLRTSPACRCCAISPRCGASRSAWAETPS
jgi:aconitate hydratase